MSDGEQHMRPAKTILASVSDACGTIDVVSVDRVTDEGALHHSVVSDDYGTCVVIEPGRIELRVQAGLSPSATKAIVFHELLEYVLLTTGWSEKLGDDTEPIVRCLEQIMLPLWTTIEKLMRAQDGETKSHN